MKLDAPLFLAILCLTACGGSPKEPVAPATDASATPATQTQAAPPAEGAEGEGAESEPAPEPDATCEKDADCTIFADCCSCKAVSTKAPLAPACDSVCGESKCEVKGKTISDVACVAGICKVK